MAFIREYASEGDPFSLRRPKWMRKLKVGRALGKVGKLAFKVAKVAAPIGLGPLGGFTKLAKIAKMGKFGKLVAIARKWGVSPAIAENFARSYGVLPEDDEDDEYDDGGDDIAARVVDAYGDTDEFGGGMSAYMGDDEYMGDPGPPKPSRKRKTAGAGPKVKAAKKRATRRRRARRHGPGRVERGLGKVLGGLGAAGEHLPGILSGMGSILKKSGGGTAEDAAMAEMAAALGGAKGAGKMRGLGGKRRTMNPANVKALRRGIRRIEGFQHLVKRVHKMFPALRGPTTSRASSPRRARGHRAGCGCVVCKRAA